MKRLSVLVLAGAARASECLLVPTREGPNGLAPCLDESALVPYALEWTVPAGSRRLLGCQLAVQLEGALARAPAAPLTNSLGVLEPRQTLFAPKLGKVRAGAVSVLPGRSCQQPWGCRALTVHDGHRFWRLDCEGLVAKPGDSLALVLSGVKRYKVSVFTDPLPEGASASASFISIRLLGADGSQSSDLTLLAAARTPGVAFSTTFTAADVGPVIRQLNVTNHTPHDPWRFKTITVTTEDGVLAKFPGAQYVGSPYATSLLVRNVFSAPADGALEDAIDRTTVFVECHTRLTDIISGSSNHPFTMKVSCPAGCDTSPLSYVVGLTLHPTSSSVCASAVADGVIGVSGGLLQLHLYPADSRDLSSLYLNVSRVFLHPYRDDPTSTGSNVYYTASRISSLDDLDAHLRVVDIFGQLAHTGRLEMRSVNGTWGSICTHGDTEQFSPEAAKIACQELGYLWGSSLTGTCGSANLCAPLTMPILAGGITCKGNEDKFAVCAIQEPAPICADHTHDTLVHCSDTPPALHPSSGTIRITDAGGMPAVRGVGRLEMFIGHEWGSVCSDRWTRTNAGVACREMGYTGVKDLRYAKEVAADASSEASCEDILGTNFCGPANQRIVVTDVVCEGSEGRLRDCALNAPDDVYCVHTEDVVVGCDGPGDPSGMGLFAAEHPPHLKYLPLKPIQKIRCTDTFESLFGKDDPKPGEMYAVRCPANCLKTKGQVIGTYVYNWRSSVCRAAIHTGMVDDTGMAFAVSAGHGQYKFIPSVNRAVTTEAGTTDSNSFHIVKMTEDLIARTATVDQESSGPRKRGGFSLLDDRFILLRENFKRPFTMDELAGREASGLSFLSTSTAQAPLPLVAFCNEGSIITKFDGSSHGQISLNDLPGGSTLSSLATFTILIRFRLSESGSGWRSLLSYGECDGFNVVLDAANEIIIEQLCTSLVIPTTIVPQLGVWTTLSIVFDETKRTLSVFDGLEEKIDKEPVLQDFRWTSHMRVGKSSTLEYQPFVGEISHVFVYNYSLVKDGLLLLAINRLRDVCSRLAPIEPSPMYSSQEYRLCMSDCTGNKASQAIARKQMSRVNLANAPAIPLDCFNDLDNTPQLNAKLNDELEVICPLNCFTNTTFDITASKLDAFPGSFPICNAAQILGFVPKQNNQRIKIRITPGKATYLPAYEAPASLDGSLIKLLSQQRDIRSYTVLAITEPRTLPCSATAEFLLFATATATDTHLFRCPPGCRGSSAAKVPDSERPVPQLHAAEPAKGLLMLRDAATPICPAAIDAGLLTSRLASDVLVHVMPATTVASTPERSKADVLQDVMMGVQLPFASTINAVDESSNELENNIITFGSAASEDAEAAAPRFFQLQPLRLSIKCADVQTALSPSTKLTDLTDRFFCDGPATIRGEIREVPAVVRVPELGVSVLFQEDQCAVQALTTPFSVRGARPSTAKREFHIEIHPDQVASWMEVGGSAISCKNDDGQRLFTDEAPPFSVRLVGAFSSVAIQRG